MQDDDGNKLLYQQLIAGPESFDSKHLRANQTLSEFDAQLNGYLHVMSNLKTEELMAYDPLLFWPKHAHTFPIFARLAR
jgi:hypothetical protein